ncbi:MAG: hypothetical protein FWC15_03210 [Fibromonadales bacterium]|nr:hypothetical protein [Fibromonadales bacterium]
MSIQGKIAKLAAAALLTSVSIAAAEDIPVVSVGGTKISFYGFLQFNSVYESGNNNNANWTEIVPSKAEDGEGRFMSNVNQTRFGFNLTGPGEDGVELSGRFETDFGNDNNRTSNGVGGFRIRQSFGQLKFTNLGLTVLMGQTSDLIAPLSAPTLNQGGLKSQGSLGTRRPQIRLTQAIGPVELAIAATDDRANKPVMPAFQGSAKVKVPAAWAGTDDNGKAKNNIEFILSGHYAAEEEAADTEAQVDAKDADGWVAPPTSWSGIASLSLPVVSIVNLSGELFYGQNLNRYNNGSIRLSGAATGRTGTGVQSMGGWGAATVKLGPVSLAGGMGVEAIDENRERKSTAELKNPNQNMAIFTNLRYNIGSSYVGFEYANLATDYASMTDGTKVDSGKLNRFELVFNYAFK